MRATFAFHTLNIGDKFRVFFSKRKDRSDIQAFDVNVNSSSGSARVIAELVVIRRVLMESNYSVELRANFDLQVSSGAIKKLRRKASTHSDAYDYSRFLITRFPEVEIKVKHDLSLISDEVDPVCIEVPKNYTEVVVSEVGPIKVTEHALARYRQRFFPEKSLQQAADDLHFKLTEKDMTPATPPVKKARSAIRRHHRNAQYWGIGSVCLVTVKEAAGYQALLTVY